MESLGFTPTANTVTSMSRTEILSAFMQKAIALRRGREPWYPFSVVNGTAYGPQSDKEAMEVHNEKNGAHAIKVYTVFTSD